MYRYALEWTIQHSRVRVRVCVCVRNGQLVVSTSSSASTSSFIEGTNTICDFSHDLNDNFSKDYDYDYDQTTTRRASTTLTQNSRVFVGAVVMMFGLLRSGVADARVGLVLCL